MPSEDEVNQALYAMEAYKGQIDSISRQRQMVMATLEEHMRAKLTIAEYLKAPSGHEILVPVGANAFLMAKSQSTDKVLIGIGGGVVIEDTCTGAMEKLDDIIKMLQDAEKRMATRMGELQGQLSELSAGVEQAMHGH